MGEVEVMEIRNTNWNEKVYSDAGGINTVSAAPVIGPLEHQPAFGFEIGWNEPRKLWKPYFALHFYVWNIQIGWLWDFKE
jgi:hypothetical protein